MDQPPQIPPNIGAELTKVEPTTRGRAFEKFFLAALGSIPWVGGFISAAVNLKTEEPNIRQNSLQSQWLREHEEKLQRLQSDVADIEQRFTALGPTIDERIQSPEYLSIVRRCFRIWDQAETEQKRTYVKNMVVNAAGSRICSDDVVRLFVDWLDRYHEMHLAVITTIFNTPGLSRADIWEQLYGEFPRDDSAEADLFRMLMRDLSIGGVIRLPRESDHAGRWLNRPISKRSSKRSPFMESATEGVKQWVLTELGKQFVHYTLTDVVHQIPDPSPSSST